MTLVFNNVNLWREEVGQRLLKLDFKALSDDPFRTTIFPLHDCDGVRVMRTRHTPGLTFRDARLAKDGNDALTMVTPLRGSFEIAHQGRSARITLGQATLLHNCEPGEVGARSALDYVAVLVPFAAIGIAPHERDALIARRWPASPAVKLLSAYVTALARAPAAQGRLAEAASRHIRDLVAIAAADLASRKADVDAHTVPGVRLKVALDYVSTHFCEHALGEAEVAAAQGISVRYLQRLFGDAGLRFTDCLNEQRLTAAGEMLADQRHLTLPIAAIALACGFSDISHFNRLYRRRFGTTPSATRLLAQT